MNRKTDEQPVGTAGDLRRSVGFYGLMFVSLGSIIGSGWLLGALNAAQQAGPASVLSWILAAFMLSLLALTYAELGATYPVAGGSGRFPYYSHGPIAGFMAGWAAWLQAVFIAPIEVLAAITYVNSVGWVNLHFNMINKVGDKAGLLNGTGLVVAVVLMVLFTAMNLAGAKFLSDSNVIVVLWKTAVPFLAVAVVAALQFTPANFHAGGGFMPFGFHGVFAALTGGVVFALQGFEQAVQLAGEARDPKRDLSRAILTAMAIGAVLYALLQIVMIGALDPRNILTGWAKPLGTDPSDYGAWYTLALAVGAGWLAKVLIIDAVISPAGTGVVYVGTTARLSYALGEEREMPSALATTNDQGRAGGVHPRGGGHRIARVRTVQELERAGQRGHRRHGDHVRLRAGVAGGAPEGRRWPATVVPDAPARARAACGILLGQPDHLLGRLRYHLEARLRHDARPCAVRRGGLALRNRRAAHGPKRRLDRALARRPGAPRSPGPLWRRQKHPAQLGRHRRGDRLRPGDLLLGRQPHTDPAGDLCGSRQGLAADRLRRAMNDDAAAPAVDFRSTVATDTYAVSFEHTTRPPRGSKATPTRPGPASTSSGAPPAGRR